MIVNTVNSNRINIILNDDEVSRIFGGYNLIDYDAPECRIKIHNLLAAAIPEELLPLDCDRLLIEVKPLKRGCTISMTKIYNREEARSEPQRQYSIALIFSSSEDMISALRPITELKIITSELYYLNEKYAIVLKCRGIAADDIIGIGEYCAVVTGAAECFKLREYWHCICKKNAVSKLAISFLK